jgi:hypothetical protein
MESWTLPCMQNSTKVATMSMAEINGLPPKKNVFYYLVCSHSIAAPMTAAHLKNSLFSFFLCSLEIPSHATRKQKSLVL